MNIVTGSGRSGTSYITQILAKCGADFSGDLKWHEKHRAGLENPEIVEMNKIMFSINNKTKPYANEWLLPHEEEKVLRIMAPIFKYMNDTYKSKWIKDPLFSKTLQVWDKGGLEVENLVLCLRDPFDSAQSANTTSKGFTPVGPYTMDQIYQEMLARNGNLFEFIDVNPDVPVYVIRYERMAQDLMAVVPQLFPKTKIHVLYKLIKETWTPKNQKYQLSSSHLQSKKPEKK